MSSSARSALLIPSTVAPQLLMSPVAPSPHRYSRSAFDASVFSRRNVAVLLSSFVIPLFPSLLQPRVASAFSIGISGPKEWLQQQKKKSAKFILAPVDASRNILQSAYLLLMKNEAEFDENDLREIQMLLISAARDCVPRDRNSFVEFQANTGVEVCTFRLIVKNASSLLDDRDPIKLEAEAKLSDLIRSFSSLNDIVREKGMQLTSDRQRVASALKDTISSLNNFEQGINDCLQV
ncbi:uncharacterized protein LOC127246604 isoform X2 [Andrographis paniculata]|uniref:uncharacterized protein LOC127246604 isoform X2 n=1 Tax=Andrographis paniculata TaxID=175694 RepID=UPI0021E872C9|nr:uncharacterized protein LOC127246604 isoform X2 [Andrographis paniculata]